MAASSKVTADTIAEMVAQAVAAALSAAPAAASPARKAKAAPAVTVPSMFRWRGTTAAKPGGTFKAKLKDQSVAEYKRHTLAEATAILEAQYAAGIFYASRV